MALQLKLSRVGINKDGTEMYLSDVTGNYVVTDNEGGWGVPNPLRSEKALFVQGIQHTSTTDDSTVFADYDPETVVNFTLKPTVDGYYEIIMVAVDKAVPVVEGDYGWTLSIIFAPPTKGSTQVVIPFSFASLIIIGKTNFAILFLLPIYFIL